MLKNFEQETQPLSEYEEAILLPLFVQGLSKRVGRENAIKNNEIVDPLKRLNYKISEVRVRKIINHIRIKGLIKGLIAASEGYYIATTDAELADYEESLLGRENAIRAVRLSIRKQRAELFQPEQKSLFE
jgi:carbamoylphosphate synthase small subunit